jgi:hypothetical protein
MIPEKGSPAHPKREFIGYRFAHRRLAFRNRQACNSPDEKQGLDRPGGRPSRMSLGCLVNTPGHWNQPLFGNGGSIGVYLC